MVTVPRVCDTLMIERVSTEPVSTEPVEYTVRNRQGIELGKVTEEGYFLLLQMDGVTELARVQERLRERFGKTSSPKDLSGWFTELENAGVLNTNDRAIRVLTYLKEQGISYRGSSADRRAAPQDEGGDRLDDARRDEASATASWFDYAIFLLNDGLIDEGLAVFERLMESQQGDVRLHELTGHLRFLAATDDLPDPPQERRDVSWDAFDAALREMLDQGACPKCDLPFVVELGANNRCYYCGASFSSYVLSKAEGERRRQPTAGD
jgi:hypothetical protein